MPLICITCWSDIGVDLDGAYIPATIIEEVKLQLKGSFSIHPVGILTSSTATNMIS